MATLIGSEKQVAWAEDIRARLVGEAEAYVAWVAEKRATLPAEKQAAGEPAYRVTLAGLDRLRSEASAAWYIGLPARSVEIRTLLRMIGLGEA